MINYHTVNKQLSKLNMNSKNSGLGDCYVAKYRPRPFPCTGEFCLALLLSSRRLGVINKISRAHISVLMSTGMMKV